MRAKRLGVAASVALMIAVIAAAHPLSIAAQPSLFDPNATISFLAGPVTPVMPSSPIAPKTSASGALMTRGCSTTNPLVAVFSAMALPFTALFHHNVEEARGLIGNDDRDLVNPTQAAAYPSSAIVQIKSKVNACTGFLYGPNMVATAGHCVLQKGFWAADAIVSPGRSDSTCPYGFCRVEKLFTTKGWAHEEKPEFDYGAIRLNCSVGQNTGWLGVDWNGLNQTTSLELIGYRSFTTLGHPRSQMAMQAPLKALNPQFVFHQHDTLQGDSGAPLFTVADATARAIHNMGCAKQPGESLTNPVENRVCFSSGSNFAQFDYGVRVTEQVVANLRAWQLAP